MAKGVQIRIWKDVDGDVWYQVAKGEWSLYDLGTGQPANLPNVTTDRMREVFPDFPY